MKQAKKNVSRNVELDKSIKFIEDLCWLLDSNKNTNFKKIPEMLIQSQTLPEENGLIYNLIGILPTLLKDETIFSTNSSLVQFAQEVLSLDITRWEKRSRFELIGLIVCNVEAANQNKLENLTQMSIELLKNKDTIKNIQKESLNKQNIFSWNDTIQKIVGRSIDEQKN